MAFIVDGGREGSGAFTATSGAVVAAIATHDGTVLLRPDSMVTIGRDPTSTIRIGHEPVYDEVVPRSACQLFAVGQRVMVANTSSHLAFDVMTEDRPPMVVRSGDWFTPPHHRFDVVIAGGAFSYSVSVTVNTAGTPATLARDDEELSRTEPRTGARPDLSPRQRQILDLYVAPVRRGFAPASHQEVADALGVSRSLVRLECNRIWSELLLTGVPMRDLPDMRDAVVDAWTRHRF